VALNLEHEVERVVAALINQKELSQVMMITQKTTTTELRNEIRNSEIRKVINYKSSKMDFKVKRVALKLEVLTRVVEEKEVREQDRRFKEQIKQLQTLKMETFR